MKICGKCKIEKDDSDFHQKRDKLQSMCKDCRKIYRRNKYLENSEKEKKDVAIWKKAFFEYAYTLVNRFKQRYGCKYCGEKRFWVLEFHHINRETKTDEISKLLHKCNLSKLKAEIRKCIILCSNCHRDLHYKENMGFLA